MNALTIIQRAQRLAGRVDAGFDDRSLQFLNEAVEQWATELPWPTLRHTQTYVCDGTRGLTFPDYVRTVRWLADETNLAPLEAREFWDREQPNRFLGNAAGSPYWWQETGIEPIYSQPSVSAPAQISFRSEVSDTYTVHISGLSINTAASGTAGYEYFTEEQITVAGSGPATSSNFYVKVLSCGKSERTAQDTLVLNGSAQIGRIPANKQRSEYRRVEFLTIPGAGTRIRAGVIVQPGPLTETFHCPHPSIDLNYLVWYTAGLIHHAQGQADQGNLKIAYADNKLKKRIQQEKLAGDKDLSAIPDQQYWGSEEAYAWP